ncbi:uncharacterized protein ACN427_011137 [Glossina fuscipes fuscipes]|uniref:Uncharacterized protein n=1 Tax=Glossina palpalis gambiensis TaxID=67801 RepID=A0A1B0BX65_9MUSC|nr:hypothetical protein GQX74_008266 [Glossina fuscipes]
MRIKCFSRKECLGLLMILIGALAVKNYLTVSFFDLMHELDIFEHQYVSACVAFISFYMGLASFFLTPKNELARTYLRAYHVLVYSVLMYFLFQSRNTYYIRFEGDINDFFDHEILDDEDYQMALNLTLIQLILMCSGMVIVVQAYMIYARVLNTLARRGAPNQGGPA